MPYKSSSPSSSNIHIGDNIERWRELRNELKVSNTELAKILLDNYHPPPKRREFFSSAMVQTDLVMPFNLLRKHWAAKHCKKGKATVVQTSTQTSTQTSAPMIESFEVTKPQKTYSRLPRKDLLGMNEAPSLLTTNQSLNASVKPNATSSRVPSIEGSIETRSEDEQMRDIFLNELTANLSCQMSLTLPNGISAIRKEVLSDYITEFGDYVSGNFGEIVKGVLEKLSIFVFRKCLGQCAQLVEIWRCLILCGYDVAYKKVSHIAACEICQLIEYEGFPFPSTELERNRNLRQALQNVIITLWMNVCRTNNTEVRQLNVPILNHVLDTILRIMSHMINFHIKVRKTRDGELKFVIEKCVLKKEQSSILPTTSSENQQTQTITSPQSRLENLTQFTKIEFFVPNEDCELPTTSVKSEPRLNLVNVIESEEPPLKVIKTEPGLICEPNAILPDFGVDLISLKSE